MSELKIGYVVWSPKQGAFEPNSGKPFRVYASRGTALKMASDWQPQEVLYGTLTVKEVFVRGEDE